MSEPLRLTWLGHASTVIELDGVRVATDPALGARVGPLLRIARSPAVLPPDAIDAVLLSHLHADHADLPSLRRIARGIPVYAPPGAAVWLARHGIGRVRELRPGERAALGAVSLTATAAVHDGRRHPFAVRTGAIGFVVRGSQALYFAGDTDLFPAMQELVGTVDLALLPVWGWGPSVGAGHLDPERAARAAALIAPRVAVPIHWGTLAPPWRRLWREADPERPAREFARLSAELAPETDVRVLAPGEMLELTAGA